MIINIYRDSALLFQSSEIIAWSFDSLSLSGVDYWSQEARQASITVLYSPALQDILEGNLREIATGFHTLNFVVINGAQTLFAGVLEVGAFKVEYLSLTDKKVELNLLDYFGLPIALKNALWPSWIAITLLPGVSSAEASKPKSITISIRLMSLWIRRSPLMPNTFTKVANPARCPPFP